VRDTAIERMRAEPSSWQRYYHADGRALALQLEYSLSDRIRYYWPDAAIQAAQARLFENLRATPPALALLSQYLPTAYAAVRDGRATLDPADLVIAHIGATLDIYHGACHPDV
jgi:D-tagatose-1,6-bisphosphate aldolase subunit GatZ/KbaZ